MNRIEQKFQELKSNNSKALIAYITGGFPNIKFTEEVVPLLERSGADIVEIGIPFSDPIADGPTIQRASELSLSRGTNIDMLLDCVYRIRKVSSIPILFMTYYNPVYARGVERFLKESKECGVDGLIIPDLLPEEAGDYIKIARRIDISTIFLLAPTSSNERIKKVAKLCTGFLYYVSVTGVTGSRRDLEIDIGEKVKKIKRATDLPVCVGFGISKPSHARYLRGVSDGIIVGSAIVKIVLNGKGKKRIFNELRNFLLPLKGALNDP